MSSRSFSGVVFNSGDSLEHLPLEQVEIRTLVVDVSARVDVIQTFNNPASTSTPRAKYVFPLPARAAVCSFNMTTSSGRVIVGVAKEKGQAKAEFEQAIYDGKKTALVEWASNDVFTISIGPVAGREQVTTTISYVLDLMDADSRNQVRLQIPMRVGERYGEAPAEMHGASSPSSKTRVRFTAHIQMRGVIESAASPSHSEMSVAPYQTHIGRPSRHRAIAKLRSPDYLFSDIVLHVKVAGLDVPRCFAERDPRGSNSLALQLTLVPKFDLPYVPSQEFIFLVDRSGSMGGSRIETAKKTLALLLRFLPGQRASTIFNIFSFGSHCDSLWQVSSPYSNAAVKQATEHTTNMDANYGGTEIQRAIKLALSRRDRSKHTTVFVLTDGDCFDGGAAASVVSAAVKSAPSSAPLRVFTLGIGAGASSDMCESIARAGNGVCLMATESDELVGKCAKLLLAGRSTLLKNVSVDWGIPPDALRQPHDPAAHTTVRQAPAAIESLYPGFRSVVFALVENADFAIPKTITLHAQRDGTGEVHKIPVPVEDVRFSDQNELRLIHTLAAQRLITDIADDALSKHTMTDEQRKAQITALGETYQLASEYTSFVAVEDDGKVDLPIPRPAWATSALGNRRAGKPDARPSHAADDPAVATLASYVNAALTFGHLFVTEFLRGWFGPPSGPSQAQGTSPGQWHDVPQNVDGATGEEETAEEDYDSDKTFSTLSSLISRSDWSDTESRPSTPEPVVRSPSPDVQRDPHSAPSQPPPALAFAGGSVSAGKQVEELIKLQSYDGSFVVDDAFRQLVGGSAVDSAPPQTDPQLWAAALAVAFCRKHMGGQQELVECLRQKVLEFVEGLGRGAALFDDLVDDAMKVL